MRWPIRNQLLVPFVLLLLGVVAISIGMAYSSARHARRQIEMRVRNVARNLSEEANYPLTVNVLLQMKQLSGADYLLVSPGGEVLTTLQAVPEELPTIDGEELAGADWQDLKLGPPIVVEGVRYLCSGIKLVRPPRAGAVLYILYPESLLDSAIWEAMRPVLIVGTVVGLASLVLIVGVGRGLSKRLRELERRTRLIARGDFSLMQLPRREDEIRDLTVSVNEMAQQLAQLHETTRRSERLRLLGQVSGGLAHQLRNGLTGARLAVQLFLQESAQAVDSAPLEKALSQLTLMETHLQRFLHLGRHSDEPREPCVLLDLVRDTLDLVEPACRHAGIELRRTFSLSKNRQVSGIAGRLGQLFVNIISNAIEAAGPGGKVEVRLSEDATRNRAIIEVRDSGPGPPADIADRLFDPFVTGKPEGVGLGLAMAHQIAEEHQGALSWSREGQQTCFRVELPLQPWTVDREP